MSREYSAVLVRFGEIGIKSDQTRKRMIRLLIQHIQAALTESGVNFSKVRSEYGRIFIETNDASAAAQEASRVFGVVSTSPVVTTSASLDSIIDEGTSLAKLKFEKKKSFAVGSRRVGTHDFSSQEIREKLGAHILKNLKELDLEVDLSSPDQSIYVEVRDENAYIFTETVKGVGGMPTGSQGKVVCMISSGLDSPVAAYKVMKRGCIPVFVHFDNSPYSDETNVELATKQAQHLAQFIYNHEVKLYIVPHGDDLTDVLTHAPRKMTCVFCRRNMYRLAREIALIEDADAIVTGEIIGEQASQTTRNLLAESSAVCDFPILRPCIGDDKVEVEHLGMEIGTYKFAHEAVSCCSLPPKHPTVHSQLEAIPEAESKMDFDVLKEEIAEAEVIILRGGKRDT
ncbi:MAG: tRNA 4-thiouridine(8) synthase ThiI [Candidatus Thorarchaeota archaeon]|nr:MAG: tRNA 4-thiouridine(8) synthase ThiI [Candidatus Thorarchaeota archaeon]